VTIRRISQDGVILLEKEPLFGYNCARKQGSLSAAVLYLSTLRPQNWCPWLATRLAKAYHNLSYETAAVLVCLAYIRWPVKPQKLVDWTTVLLGEEHRSSVETTVAELMFRGDDFENAVQFPFSDDQIQLNSNWRWDHIPDVELLGKGEQDETTNEPGDRPLAE